MKIDKNSERALELFLVLIVFVFVNVMCFMFQPNISHHDGKGWDGFKYYQVAEDFSLGNTPCTNAPFVYRIGVPYAASLICKDNLIQGFKIVNIAGNLILIILFVLWLRIYINNWKIRFLVCLLILTQWYGPFRYVFYCPVLLYSWHLVFLVAGLLLVHYIRLKRSIYHIILLCILVFFGALVKETVIIIPFVLMFADNPIKYDRGRNILAFKISRFPPLIYFLPMVSVILGLTIPRLLSNPDNSMSFMKTAIYWLYEKPLLSYIHSWFIFFGPIIIVLVYFWKRTVKFLLDHQFMCAYLIVCSLLAWIGGSDTDRLLSWSMPVTYLLIGLALEKTDVFRKSFLLSIVLIAGQSISQRLFMITPDYPNVLCEVSTMCLTPWGNNALYFNLLSHEWGLRPIQLLSLVQYILFALILIAWIDYRNRKIIG